MREVPRHKFSMYLPNQQFQFETVQFGTNLPEKLLVSIDTSCSEP